MLNYKNQSLWLPIILFTMAFLGGPIAQMHGFFLMPGDIGDTRLNNYFLENIYQYLRGHSESLWHLGFFTPFPYILGFSDNLFGSAPIYLLARLFSQSDTAFQVWFLLGYIANFISAYYALRSLKAGYLGASVGALIFTFALPAMAQIGHSQLQYRFAVPLATAAFIHFLNKKQFHLFTLTAAWLTWQFYCSIYLGFFALLLLLALLIVYIFHHRSVEGIAIKKTLYEFVIHWRSQPRNLKNKHIFYLALFFVLLLLLFYPYFEVSHLYHYKRSWSEIRSMLPRLHSYLLGDSSYWWWSAHSEMFNDMPARNEHQLFVGIIPLLLALYGFLLGNREKNGINFTLLSNALALLILMTLCVGGISLWVFFANLPLASSIRSMSRIILIFLFPVGYLAAIAIDDLMQRKEVVRKLIWVVVLPLLLIEFSAIKVAISPKKEWRERLVKIESLIPKQLPDNPILFFAHSKEGPFYADEIDAMWVALNHQMKTLNGYSGFWPPGFTLRYGTDCREIPKRILTYLNFIHHKHVQEEYVNLMKRIVPIGFTVCDPAWLKKPPENDEEK